MPRLLELFAGTQSVSRVARRLGWDCVSLDICPRHAPDLCMSILDFDESAYPRDAFDFVWASPPCEAFSVAKCRGRGGCAQLLEVDMAKADALVAKTKRILAHFSAAHYCVENPKGSRLWNREVARELRARSVLVSYCQYGYNYRKTTRLAVSFPLSLPVCPGAGRCAKMIGTKHLQHAQRGGGGAEAGGRMFHTMDELHSIPEGLVEDLLAQLQEAAERREAARAQETRAQEARESMGLSNAGAAAAGGPAPAENAQAGGVDGGRDTGALREQGAPRGPARRGESGR